MYRDLIDQQLPADLRRSRIQALLYSFVQPLIELHDTIQAYMADVRYQLDITAQVMQIEKLLNDRFNSGVQAYYYDGGAHTYLLNTGVIYITDANKHPQPFLFSKAENVPLYLYTNADAHTPPTYLYSQADYDSQLDFIVMIPTAVGDVTNPIFSSQIKAWINLYRYAGMRYQLINY